MRQPRSECRGVRETCLDDFCECVGDCNLDGIVFGSDITTMVLHLGRQLSRSSDCPAGDINQDGDGEHRPTSHWRSINLGLGCPGEGSPLIFARDRTNETRTLEVGNITGIPGEFVDIDHQHDAAATR